MNKPVNAEDSRREHWRVGPIYHDTIHSMNDGNVYMRRWILETTQGVPWVLGRFLEWWSGSKVSAVRLHCIHREDQDRHMHDHPFDLRVWVLAGGYDEVLPIDSNGQISWAPTYTSEGGQPHAPVVRLRRSPSWRSRGLSAEQAHRIPCLHGSTSWSLVLAGPRRRLWGFHTEDGWVSFKEYTG